MIIRRNCLLLPTIIVVILWEQRTVVAARRKQSDSILEIMNTREIEQLIAERRLNASREDSGRFIIQNDLDEDFVEPPSSERYRPQYGRTSSSVSTEIEYGYNANGGGGGGGGNQRQATSSGDPFLPYNDSLLPDRGYTPDLLADLQAFRSGNILKSSKNALFVTRREYLKKDWCKTEPLVQRIRENGCLTRTIVNRFCYGQCNSFYIPKSPKRRRNNIQAGQMRGQQTSRDQFEDEDLTAAAFRSCGFCKPKKFTWITVTLRCPSMVPQLRKKRVQRIKQCRCMAQPLD